jgi:predicted CopG family antitoxin
MSSISVDETVKAKFDEMKPDDMTHSEFVSELLDAKRRDEGQIVNPSEIVDEITKQTAAEVELASYRGTRSALQSVLEEHNP